MSYTYHKVQKWMCSPSAHPGPILRIIAHGLASRNRNLHGTSPRFAYAIQLASQSLSYMLGSWGLQPKCPGSSRHGKGMCQCRLSLEYIATLIYRYIDAAREYKSKYKYICVVLVQTQRQALLRSWMAYLFL